MRDSYQRGFSWLHALFGLVILIVTAGLAIPWLQKQSRRGTYTKAISNAKAITGALGVFRHEYGSFPCDDTRKILTAKDLTTLPAGKSANAYLAQLIATDTVDSETYFFAGRNDYFRKGDDIKNTPENILEQGENGFLYIMAEGGDALKADLGITPIIMALVDARGTNPIFDTKIYGGKFVYGSVNGSCGSGHLSENGTAMSPSRAHLLEPGPDSLFGNQVPVVTYPLGFQGASGRPLENSN